MFSYFKNGITDIVPQRSIDFPELVNQVLKNPHAEKFNLLRQIKNQDEDQYRILKKTLPNITPHCIVKRRCLKGDQADNLVVCSGYFYFDIDNISDVPEYKNYLIDRYGDAASLICTSSGGQGVSMLFKVSGNLSPDNFESTRRAIIKTILYDERIDDNASGIGRAMFISSDADAFFNYENHLIIDSLNNFLPASQTNSWCSSYNRVSCQDKNEKKDADISKTYDNNKYKVYPIDQVLSQITTKTNVPVLNPVVDFKEVDFLDQHIHIIKDGNKHKTYYRLIHQWYFLNPGIDIDYLYSYLFFINNNRAKPKMEIKELVRFFTSVIDQIQTSGIIHVVPKTKRVHFNPAAKLCKKEKITIANNLNACYRNSLVISKILEAKEELLRNGEEITVSAVVNFTKLDYRTVKKHFMSEQVDMEYQVGLWN